MWKHKADEAKHFGDSGNGERIKDCEGCIGGNRL